MEGLNSYVTLQQQTEVTAQLHAPAALHGNKKSLYQQETRLDGPQNRYRRRGEEKNIILPEMKSEPA
jgi:hypothetical protein